jgi:hypothetical protein
MNSFDKTYQESKGYDILNGGDSILFWDKLHRAIQTALNEQYMMIDEKGATDWRIQQLSALYLFNEIALEKSKKD